MITETETRLLLEPHPRNPRARQRVLSGQDGAVEFRVVIPMRIRTVADALAWLRPKYVSENALRQGEFFFIKSYGPHRAAACSHDHGRTPVAGLWECGSEEQTPGGSYYRRTVQAGSFSPTHRALYCLSVRLSGEVMFIGRRGLRSHPFEARPQYFVARQVEHAEHGVLDLPAHDGGLWYEVVPNKAHGPFPVLGYGRGD